MDQLSFASLDFAAKKKRTKRDVFLAEMAAVVPWGVLEAVIEPHYPKVGANPACAGNPPASSRSAPETTFAGLEVARDRDAPDPLGHARVVLRGDRGVERQRDRLAGTAATTAGSR